MTRPIWWSSTKAVANATCPPARRHGYFHKQLFITDPISSVASSNYCAGQGPSAAVQPVTSTAMAYLISSSPMRPALKSPSWRVTAAAWVSISMTPATFPVGWPRSELHRCRRFQRRRHPRRRRRRPGQQRGFHPAGRWHRQFHARQWIALRHKHDLRWQGTDFPGGRRLQWRRQARRRYFGRE